jgi:phosphoribosylformylglycinamidine synthase PurS subunit
MKMRVLVRLKAGVLDVQGKAVEHGIESIGVNGIKNVRIGRLVEFDIDASSVAAARPILEDLCQKLFANTVIENYEIQGV